MNRFISLSLLAVWAALPAHAELGHTFAPIKPEDLAKIQAAMPEAKSKPAKPRRLLVFFLTEGFVHESIPYANEAIKEMGEKTGAYTTDLSEDMGVFTAENLKKYDAVLFNNTTGLKFADPAARQALLDFVHAGKGVAGIHSATDNFPAWPEGQELLGGKFDGHPWTAGDVEAVKVDDPKNPIVAAFGGKGFWINDEIYQMTAPFDRNHVRVLLSLDMSKPQNARDPKNIHRTDNDFAISWIKKIPGGGRVFYCSLGHNPSIYWTPQVLQTYLNGIQFALGDFSADARPSGSLAHPPKPALAPETPDPINNHAASAAIKPAGTGTLAAGLSALAAYDYGLQRNDIVAFDDYIRAQPREERPKIEAALLPLLTQASTSAAAKEWILRTLFIIGSPQSIPVLEKFTADPKWNVLAVDDLFAMGTPAARAALVKSLDEAAAPLRPALIGAIGRLEMKQLVPKLAMITQLDDQAQAAAALDALGAIGNSGALTALRKASVPAALETTRQWALMHAAYHVLKTQDDSAAAKAVFQSLGETGKTGALRVAAARGILQASPASAWPVLARLLKDDDSKVRLDAGKLTPQLSSIAPLAAALPDLDPAVQIVIVNAFAQTRKTSAAPILDKARASTNPEVHLAGIAGYGTANLPRSVAKLMPFLQKPWPEASVAIASLSKISDPGAPAALKAALASSTGAAKADLLTILSNRTDRSVTKSVFAAATDSDHAVAEAAFAAMGKIVTADDFPALLELLPHTTNDSERKHLEAALIYAAARYTDKDKATGLIVAALNSATGDNRPTLIATLVSIDSTQAYGNLHTLLTGTSADDRKATIRALSAAHSPRGDMLLLEAAAKSPDDSEKVLAVRGYLDSIRAQNFRDQRLIDAYKTAWPLATRQEEKDAILAGLKNMNKPEANDLIQQFTATAAVTPAAAH